VLRANTHSCVDIVHIGPYIHSMYISSARCRWNEANHLWRENEKYISDDWLIWLALSKNERTMSCQRTILMKDVFPAPFGPSIPKHWPFGRASDNPRTASLSGFPSFPW
jgi:hypothetical protein